MRTHPRCALGEDHATIGAGVRRPEYDDSDRCSLATVERVLGSFEGGHARRQLSTLDC